MPNDSRDIAFSLMGEVRCGEAAKKGEGTGVGTYHGKPQISVGELCVGQIKDSTVTVTRASEKLALRPDL